jgi:subtilisin family serine protease
MKFGRIMLVLFTISIISVGTIPFSTQVFANQNTNQFEQSTNPDIIPGQYIVILKDDVSPQKILKKYGVGKIHQYEHAFNGLAIIASENQISALKSDSRVVYIENDSIVRASAQTIPPGITRIGATQSTTDFPIEDFSDVTIAILDTGIDLDHPDLNVDTTLSKTFASGGRDANDKNGHGTHVAGTSAAINNSIGVVGVAQNAKLIAVKVLGNNGGGFTSDIIAGIDYVKSLNEDNPGTVDVINMSLGGSGSCGAYQLAIDNVNKGNVTVVVAAGNESDDATNHRPANCDGVITVSAIKDTDGQSGALGDPGDDKFASFSNYGDKVKISAPGVSIESTWKDGSYNTISGTSMASPHVAGAVAVIKHNDNSGLPLNFDNILSILETTGIKQTSDLSTENGIDCSTDPDNSHEKLVYLGTDSTVGTCDTTVTPPPDPDPEPDPITSCTDPGITNLQIDTIMDLKSKGRWSNLLIPVHVSVEGIAVSGICVDLDLVRFGNNWDFLGTTDSNGDIVFKLGRALDDTPYTATVVNQSHFPSGNSDFTECKQIVNKDLAEC